MGNRKKSPLDVEYIHQEGIFMPKVVNLLIYRLDNQADEL